MITIPVNLIFIFNIAIVVFYILLFMKGCHSGFLVQLIDLFGTLISFFVAWRYSDIGNNYFNLVPKSIVPFQDTILADEIYSVANRVGWFLILFIICKILFLLLSKLFKGIHEIPFLKEISSALGGIFGLLTATIWVVVICTVLRMPIFSNGIYIYNNSWLSNVNEVATSSVEMLGISTESSDLVNTVVSKVKDLSDNDKEMITEWLEEQGYQDKSK